MRLIVPSLLLLVAGCAATPKETARAAAAQARQADRLATRLAGYTPGRPQDCLPTIRPAASTETIGATILYVQSVKLLYRNDTTGGCENAEHGDYYGTVSPIGRLCRGDIARTFQANTGNVPTGSCALGAFVPYTRP